MKEDFNYSDERFADIQKRIRRINEILAESGSFAGSDEIKSILGEIEAFV